MMMSGKLAAAARSVARFQVSTEDDLQLLPAGRGAAGTHADRVPAFATRPQTQGPGRRAVKGGLQFKSSYARLTPTNTAIINALYTVMLLVVVPSGST